MTNSLQPTPLMLHTSPQMAMLTATEQEIAALLCNGYTPSQAAQLLKRSQQTVKSQLRRIYFMLDIPEDRVKSVVLVNHLLLPEGHPLRWDR